MDITPSPYAAHIPARSGAEVPPMVAELRAAAERYDARHDYDRAATCAAMADKLAKFGDFASEKQAAFARDLVARSLPPAPVAQLPKLADTLRRTRKLRHGVMTLSASKQTGVVWVRRYGHDKPVAKLVDGALFVWGRDGDLVRRALEEVEADLEAAAALHGRTTGQCSVCGGKLEPWEHGAGIHARCRVWVWGPRTSSPDAVPLDSDARR